MAETPPNTVHSEGDAISKLLPLVYAELKSLAGRYLQGRDSHTLQPTALVHEAYLKLAAGDARWADQDHFVAIAARAMRQVLVDHARAKGRDKRGGGAAKADIQIETLADASAQSAGDAGMSRELRVLELDELLNRLARDDERAARVAELRLFGGMGQDQISRVLEVSRKTVTDDWAFARAWLTQQYGGGRADG